MYVFVCVQFAFVFVFATVVVCACSKEKSVYNLRKHILTFLSLAATKAQLTGGCLFVFKKKRGGGAGMEGRAGTLVTRLPPRVQEGRASHWREWMIPIIRSDGTERARMGESAGTSSMQLQE